MIVAALVIASILLYSFWFLSGLLCKRKKVLKLSGLEENIDYSVVRTDSARPDSSSPESGAFFDDSQ